MANARIIDYQLLLASGGEAIIRAGVPSDAAGLRDLEQALADRGLYARDEISSTHDLKRMLAEHAEQPDQLELVAEVDGRVVAELRFAGAGLGRLRLQVHPQWRRRGIGASLLMTLLAWARASEQVDQLALWVLPDDQPALALYKRFGFRVVGPAPRDGMPLDSVLLARSAR